MKNKKKLIDVAVVTLFNPHDNVFDNIRTYLPYIKELLIVDNSEISTDLSLFKKEFPSVTVLSSSINLGISKALNLATEYAKDKGYKWLLTMDQDSYFSFEEIKKFVQLFQEYDKNKLAIFAPLHNQKSLKKDVKYHRLESCVMTSANIINIDKSLKIGGFDERLFIDEVDHDFCLRLNEAGYRIVQSHNCYVNHTLGEQRKSLDLNLYNSKRLYYMARNYLYIRQKHKKRSSCFFKERDAYLLKFFIKQIFYAREKREYIKMLYLGVKDYNNDCMGYRVKL